MHKALRFVGWPFVVGILIALLLIERYPHWVGLPDTQVRITQAPASIHPAQRGPVSYANAVRIASPAVANIYTLQSLSEEAALDVRDPIFDQLFHDSLPRQKRADSSLGSAVIVSREGYLLTNSHVTAGAERIIVALKDGRETQARLIGSDAETDIAVLKIDLPELPAIILGDSEQMQIGDVVLAIGNPYGVGQTVTIGIISATGRSQLGLNTYEDFIQTDAAINPGSSGGALIDTDGNLLGINTAIFSQSGGSQGIGFAIPVKLAIEVMREIIQHGQVVRGWLGLEVQPLTPELAEAFDLQHNGGIIVTGIQPSSPAQLAGLRPGDLILSIDGQPAQNGQQIMNQVTQIKPGRTIRIDILRQSKSLTLTARIGTRHMQH